MQEVLLQNAWVAIALPVLLSAVVAALGSRSVPVTRWIAALGPVGVLAVGALGVLAATTVAGRGEAIGGAVLSGATTIWLGGVADAVRVGWSLDGLAAVMLVVVGVVALMVMVFSGGYMQGERGLARYYAVLSLFTAAMAGLVLADGFVPAFVAWEVMGACSYLLIGFWFDKPIASAAANKAFLVTRVGDAGLLLGIALLWSWGGLVPFRDLGAAAENLAPGAAVLVALLVLAGAVGKSAQFPLHIWLPDAMEGPTPVSALIHAATMVAAGVFLVVRAWPLFEAAPAAQDVALVLGTLTALGAAAAAVAQHDLKKVLAYSTVSQLGFMFAALGAGSPAAATFHLVTHAAFKSLLFLGAGSVIHGVHTQDVREMGGLAKEMPLTAATWIAGSAALAGVPLFSGFFSKDAVLHAVWAAQPIAGAALFAASALTAFYITRATVLTFFAPPRRGGRAHEVLTMTLPLAVLAVPAVGAGLAGARLLETVGAHEEPLNLAIAGVATGLGLLGVVAAVALYRLGPEGDRPLQRALGPAWSAFADAYGIDTAERRVFGGGSLRVAQAAALVDRRIVDGAVEATGRGAARLGRLLSRVQSGDGQRYASLLGLGVIVALVLALMGER